MKAPCQTRGHRFGPVGWVYRRVLRDVKGKYDRRIVTYSRESFRNYFCPTCARTVVVKAGERPQHWSGRE